MTDLNYVKNYRPPVYTGPTSMVTMIIPPDTNLDDIRQEIKQESNTANNIKNNTNRKSVQQALTCLSSYIKKMKRLPDTGVALFAEQYV